ncbi:MAG: hypothetical protein M1837_007488 [Sclerophora amabilis]|nr:MAG: hypothetical protein M1837_007488 [Sclerophora amabilis]
MISSRSAPAAFSSHDLELMHHFSTETYLTLTNRQDLKRLWKIVVPQEAFGHEFLMRGILAISALHLSYLRPQHKETYLFTALSHQNMALKLVRSAMQEITRANCNAVFAFSSLVVVFAFASPHFEESLILVKQSEEPAEWVNLIRGVRTILKPTWDWIRNGTLGLLVRDGLDVTSAAASEETVARLGRIQRLCEDTSDGYEAKESYTEAMMQLRACFIDTGPAETEERQLAIAFVWPAIVPETYISMLRKKRPEALIILAHYCIILHLVDDYWWMKGRAFYLVKNVQSMLEDPWRRWIEWPASVVGLEEKEMT